MNFKLDKKWRVILKGEFKKPYMKQLKSFLQQERDSGAVVYPKGADIFNALNSTPLDKVKVVIIGQDPYHGEGQSHGLAFSVKEGVKIPPSLRNIYKELEREYKVNMPKDGDLTYWAEQGVLLLNATLTVRKSDAASHQTRGWENFTDAVVYAINEKCEHVVFILWGTYAQKKCSFIDLGQHLILEASHPSPLSARHSFFGCNHFKKANKYLNKHGRSPIDWAFQLCD